MTGDYAGQIEGSSWTEEMMPLIWTASGVVVLLAVVFVAMVLKKKWVFVINCDDMLSDYVT